METLENKLSQEEIDQYYNDLYKKRMSKLQGCRRGLLFLLIVTPIVWLLLYELGKYLYQFIILRLFNIKYLVLRILYSTFVR